MGVMGTSKICSNLYALWGSLVKVMMHKQQVLNRVKDASRDQGASSQMSSALWERLEDAETEGKDFVVFRILTMHEGKKVQNFCIKPNGSLKLKAECMVWRKKQLER